MTIENLNTKKELNELYTARGVRKLNLIRMTNFKKNNVKWVFSNTHNFKSNLYGRSDFVYTSQKNVIIPARNTVFKNGRQTTYWNYNHYASWRKTEIGKYNLARKIKEKFNIK